VEARSILMTILRPGTMMMQKSRQDDRPMLKNVGCASFRGGLLWERARGRTIREGAGLGAADRDLGLFLVVHAELVGALEQGRPP